MATNNVGTIALTRDDRIKQLVDVDKNLVKLLQSAGLAIRALSEQSHEADNCSRSFEDRKAMFTDAASSYFSLLSSVDVSLRRQIYALEEANIVPTEAIPKDGQGKLNGGGLGALDVGWLNSRNDKVGKEMESELFAKARHLVDAFEKKHIHNGIA